jgi:hypothetical protein
LENLTGLLVSRVRPCMLILAALFPCCSNQVTIGYTVVAATGMSYIARWACAEQGKAAGGCFEQVWAHVLIFSGLQVRGLKAGSGKAEERLAGRRRAWEPRGHSTGLKAASQRFLFRASRFIGSACRRRAPFPPWPLPQLLMSQLPNLESVAGASAVGAVTSVVYTFMALGLSFTAVSNRRGSALGRGAPPLDKALGVFNAIGSMLFANASAVLTIDVRGGAGCS